MGSKWFLRALILVVVLISGTALKGQEQSFSGEKDSTALEVLRKKGYEARMQGDLELSMKYYLQVLEIDPNDWDANLAVGRMYFSLEDYKKTSHHFRRVYDYDSTNTEAIWGIGRCEYRTGNFVESVHWYRKALRYMPDHIPLLEDLSYALVNSGKQKEALAVYLDMIRSDSSFAMAWAGAGRVYQLSGKPYSAAKFLKRALKLDPGNKDIEALYKKAKGELALIAGYQFMYINETEPIDIGSDTAAYRIDALVQSLSLTKRISDRVLIRFSHLLDHSNRAYDQQDDEQRWYDATALHTTLLLGKNRLGFHLGGSFAENQFTSYGISWDYANVLGKIRINNTFSSGYAYYYYWNQVGHDYISDHLRLRMGKFTADVIYRYVNVRPLPLIEPDTIARNPGQQYTLSLKYSLFKNPVLTLGLYHHYRDYQYKSSRYWSPQDRKLNGGTASLYWETKKGFTGTVNGNMGRDSDDIQHWEASAEMGYRIRTMTYSLGAARFYNPWYENFIAYLSVTKRFVR